MAADRGMESQLPGPAVAAVRPVGYAPYQRNSRFAPPTVDRRAPKSADQVREAPMNEKIWANGGRPSRAEVVQRKGRFLALIADGQSAEEAAVAANLSFRQALRVVTESSFNEIVQAIRAGEIAVAVVRTADTDPHQVAA